MNEWKKRLKAFLKTPKGGKTVIILIILAAALIALSDFFPLSEEKEETKTVSKEEEERRLEERLKSILESMEGVGKCEVMITFAGTAETVYATEKTAENSSQTAEEYILIEDKEGNQTALSRFTLSPSVCGVVVVCEGGFTAEIQARVTQAVKTALGIGSDRIFVTDAIK